MKSAIKFIFKMSETLFLRSDFKEKEITKWEPTFDVVPLTFFQLLNKHSLTCACGYVGTLKFITQLQG